MIQSIRATFQCDSCGREFSVAIDPAYLPPATWTVMDIADDYARQGLSYRGPMQGPFHIAEPRITPDGGHLCDVCSRKDSDDDQ